MQNTSIQVNMFGKFSLSCENGAIDDGAGRSYKMWLVLAYLLYHRDRPVKQEELYRLLWQESDDREDPQNAFRAIMHRVRTTLSRLHADGRSMIKTDRSGYFWSPEYPVELDIDRFDALCASAVKEEDEEERLEQYLEALALYQGDFLSRLSSESWVMPLTQYYRERYLALVHAALVLLQDAGRCQDTIDLCRRALETDPYDEQLYLTLMKMLLETGDHEAVVAVYNAVSKLYANQFGVLPCDEIRAIYYTAIRTVNETAIPMETLQEQIREPVAQSGAMVCEYDFFRTVCQSTARLIERSGAAVHLLLISVVSDPKAPLSRRSLELTMTNLKEQIRRNLRRGDVVSQCSPSQYVVLLPMANYENSCMVCQRLIHAFFRTYPHSPARLEYAVQALEVEESFFRRTPEAAKE
ncbi:MAG: hypothetical protein E7458_06665 [Ruminococcaceae bacterium]|nr:hypothetical protein [Oscillospiraceae bacterium]